MFITIFEVGIICVRSGGIAEKQFTIIHLFWEFRVFRLDSLSGRSPLSLGCVTRSWTGSQINVESCVPPANLRNHAQFVTGVCIQLIRLVIIQSQGVHQTKSGRSSYSNSRLSKLRAPTFPILPLCARTANLSVKQCAAAIGKQVILWNSLLKIVA